MASVRMTPQGTFAVLSGKASADPGAVEVRVGRRADIAEDSPYPSTSDCGAALGRTQVEDELAPTGQTSPTEGEVVMNRSDGRRPFSYSGRDAFSGARADVPDGEETRLAGLERERSPAERRPS